MGISRGYYVKITIKKGLFGKKCYNKRQFPNKLYCKEHFGEKPYSKGHFGENGVYSSILGHFDDFSPKCLTEYPQPNFPGHLNLF